MMNSLGVKMASPGVLWEWHRTLAGVTGSQGFSNSHLPSSERFFPRGIPWKNNLLSPSSGVSTMHWVLPSKLFWNLITSSHFHLQSLIQVSSPNWGIVYSLIDILPSALDVHWSQSRSLCLESSGDSLSHSEWGKKKTLHWSKSPNQSINFSLCLLISLGSSLCPAPTAFSLFPQQMPVPRIPDHFLFKPYSVVFIFTGHKGSKTWRSWF